MQYDLLDKIPTLDLNDFISGKPNEKEKFVNELGESFENIGFIALKNHGFEETLQAELYRSIKSFYDLPENIKNNYDGSKTGGQRGYTGRGKEHAAGRNIGDLKEFYHIGKEINDSDSLHYQKNIFPVEVPSFENATLDTYEKLEEIGKKILSAIALFLDLEEHHFESRVNRY